MRLSVVAGIEISCFLIQDFRFWNGTRTLSHMTCTDTRRVLKSSDTSHYSHSLYHLRATRITELYVQNRIYSFHLSYAIFLVPYSILDIYLLFSSSSLTFTDWSYLEFLTQIQKCQRHDFTNPESSDYESNRINDIPIISRRLRTLKKVRFLKLRITTRIWKVIRSFHPAISQRKSLLKVLSCPKKQICTTDTLVFYCVYDETHGYEK